MNSRANSKYRQIYNEIRRRITDQDFAAGDQIPTEYELTRLYGVSRPTVTKALNMLQRDGLIDRRSGAGSFVKRSGEPEDKEKGEPYFGLLIPKLGVTEIFEPICASIAQLSQEFRFHVLWGDSAAHGEVSVAEAAEHTCSRYIDANVAGVFYVPLELVPEARETNRRIAGVLEESKLPVVMLDSDWVPFPSRSSFDLVGIDNIRAGHIVTDHFLDQGCRRVDFVHRGTSAFTIDSRIYGYRIALGSRGIQFDPQWVHVGEPSDYAFVREILESGATDIVCANDSTAFDLLDTLGKIGVEVPTDVRLLGFDDVRFSRYARVPLTTVRQPCEAIGRLAVFTMLERLRTGGGPPVTVYADPQFIVRQSSVR